MKDHELDELMRDYEAEVAAYKRLPQSEPTALLDRAILTKARAAVDHAEPVRQRPPRWIAMAASFAGVAIAASVGWQVFEARQKEANVPASAPAVRERAFEVEVLPSNHGERERGLEMAQMPAPPPPPAAPAAPPKPEPQAFEEQTRAKQEAATASAPTLADQASVVQKAIMPDPHQRADHGGAAAVPERRQNIAPPAVSAPAPMTADALGAVSIESERKRDEADADSKLKETVASPQEWLARIRQLVRDRRYTEARTEMYRFRTEYPDVVIPVDLRRYAP